MGSQPPLVIPSTQLGDTSPFQTPPFQALSNSVHGHLIRRFSTPSAGSSPRSTRKRLSVASNETTSSVESSSSSGVYDLNLATTEEEASIRSCISTPLEEKLSNAVKRNRQRKLSREISPKTHSNIIERLGEQADLYTDRPKSLNVEETLALKVGKDNLEENRKRNKTVPSLGERERSKSAEETTSESPVLRRNTKEKDINNTVPRRRSFIERISIKSHFDIVSKRRNSLDMSFARNGKSSEVGESQPRKRSGQSTEVQRT